MRLQHLPLLSSRIRDTLIDLPPHFSEKLDKRGLKPIFDVLASLGLPLFPTYINITEDFDYSTYNFDWLETVIKVKTQIGMDVIIGFDIFADPKNSSTYTLAMGTPETTNPFPSLQYKQKSHRHGHPRRFYESHKKYSNLNRDEHDFAGMMEVKDEERYNFLYAQLMKIFVSESKMFKDSKLTEAELDENIITAKDAYVSIKNDIYELETDNSTDSDEDYQNIPRFTVEELQTHTDINVENNNATISKLWKKYLEGIYNISDVILDLENDKILVSELDLKYLAQIAAYMAKTPPVLIELYIWIKVVEVMAVHTTSELRALFEKAYQLESSHYYSGSRSLQCANAVNDMLGMAVSYGIADPHFFNVTKPKIEIMLNELKNSLAHLVGQAKWMDDSTKLATYQKIIQMKSLIGFPDWLLEEGKLDEYYEGIEVQADRHLENMINIIQAMVKKGFNKYHGIHNITWATEPTEVNAYHTFQHNTIRRYFDKNGNALPWWTNETIGSFEDKTKCFVDQYSNYYLPELDKHVDGKKTLGENIADNGGVREALAALHMHLRKTGPERKLPGFEKFTSEQMFFLSYGNLWCGVSTSESLKSDLEDEHAPQQFRVTGTLQNEAAFAKAWKCAPGSFMNPANKCIIY
ncbi:Uncharacterized protein OBRU01_07460 [Operophtera brumata]|uniref:Uncharacterized protein n=1 Tax=Operophtera brumata TaxID=104452 RepID=A0A0L7LAG9_OPEBR|nr:Uncharacterized protein OBRU01_07460 [Operophtera brumata]